MNEQLDNLRYPIGQFEYGKPYPLMIPVST